MIRIDYEEYLQGGTDVADWWDCDESSERLCSSCIHDAIAEHVDKRHPDLVMPGDELEVFGYNRKSPTLSELGDPLEYMLEQIGEENGDPEGYQEPSGAMLRAQARFKGEILRLWHEERRQWACEIECVVTVRDLHAYCVENVPDSVEL